mgnify:CR=1 FL=1
MKLIKLLFHSKIRSHWILGTPYKKMILRFARHCVIALLASSSIVISAHGGNTNSDNCHQNNKFNETHCHNSNLQPPVKQSKSMICHELGSPYYSKTKNFTPFSSLNDCLQDGGRLPKR